MTENKNKKRIGILTFHRADNLGAVLQAYALTRVLRERFGADAEIIDYRVPKVEINGRITKGLRAFAMRIYYAVKHRSFELFRREHLRLSAECSKETVSAIADGYDAFVTGSDQVFNYDCSGWDDGYFLDFVPAGKEKYSYAASVGNYEFTAEEKKHTAELLDGFGCVSVRESSAYTALERLSGEKLRTDPDPVMLLSGEEWKEIMPSHPLCRQKYLFLYLIQPDAGIISEAEKYASAHGLKIINNKKSPEFILHGSPAEFLRWIQDAECVFTNSFHGTAFSLVFGKSLAADIRLSDGRVNTRVRDLLSLMGAERCIISDEHTSPAAVDAQAEMQRLRDGAFAYIAEIAAFKGED